MAPGRPGIAALRLSPVFDASARLVPLTLDNVRIIVVRPPSQVLATVSQPFDPANSQLQVSIPVVLLSNSEDLEVTLELYSGTTLLFSGTRTLRVTAGGSTPPEAIQVSYQGPGSQIVSLTITPRDATILLGGTLTLGASGLDAQQAPVPDFYVGWRADAGTVTAGGLFTAPLVRDTVVIRAVAPNAQDSVEDSTLVFVVAGPGGMTIFGGNLQTGSVSSRLLQPLEVRVTGTDLLPLTGVQVAFTATTGGGSVDSAIATTDVNGIARTGANLGPAVGPQTFTANSSGLVPVVFTATGATVSGNHSWTGATSDNWSVATNWNPAAVPGATSDVVIPSGTPNSPRLTTGGIARTVTVNSGATLNLNGLILQASGNVFADGTITGGGAVQIGAAGQVRGTMPALTIGAVVTAAGPVILTGDLTVSGAGADFVVNGRSLTVGGNLAVQTSAVLTMTNAADLVLITGNAMFSGGNELTRLSAGTLSVGGNLSQLSTTSGDSYHPSGTQVTVFTGASPTITFQSPGDQPGSSHFQNAVWAGTGTLTLGSDVYAHGTFTLGGTNGRTITSTNRKLTAGAFAAPLGGVTLNNTPLVINQTASVPLSVFNITFQGMATDVVQLTIRHPGAATPFTFNNLVFQTTPVAPNGFYLDVIDVDGGTNGLLTISMINPTPTTPGVFTRATGGASVVWPVAGMVWTGALNTNWDNPSNWNPVQVPNNASDIVVPSGTPNSPQITTSCSVRTLTVNIGATLNLGAFNCAVGGNVFADGAITGTGAVQIAVAAQIRGNLPGLILSGPVSAGGGPVVATGNLTVTGAAGAFTVAGQTVTVGGSLAVQSGALLIMTNPADAVSIAVNASFSGGDELTLMSAGVLTIGGTFTQVGTGGASPDSYHPSGTHLTIFTGASPTITFGTPGDVPGSSHFQDAAWTGTGTLTLTPTSTPTGR